jgi:hypothetical protein
LELEPRYFFLITNWTLEQRSGEAILAHYRKRGTFEDRLGEFNEVIGCRLSSPNFHENEATILLGLLAFNLATMLRNELEYELGGCWDLRRFQQSVLRAGARVIKKSRRLHLYIEQAAAGLWEAMVRCISRLKLPDRWTKPRGPRTRAYIPAPPHAHQQPVLRH